MLTTDEHEYATRSLHLEASPHFQRSISLEFDLEDANYINFFSPTDATVEALERVLDGLDRNPRQRSHVLLGAYGTGKSLLGLTLAALLDPHPQLLPALEQLQSRLIKGGWTALAERIEQRVKACEGQHLLVLTLRGDEGELSAALIRAARQALQREQLDRLQLPGFYSAALATLGRWRQAWPEVYTRWQALTREHFGQNAEELEEGLRLGHQAAYDNFCQLYPQLAAGATFDPYIESLAGRNLNILNELIASLKNTRYTGLAIIWDEFGRFLEERASEAFGRDAQLLQDLAERCARSGEDQLHLVLITHKSLRQYGRGLAGGVDREWSKIEGRFSSVEIVSDPQTVYHLIERGINFTNLALLRDFIEEHQIQFDRLIEGATTSGLFTDLAEEELRQLIVEGTYPLHPLSTYCLPRLSDRVAQNQRTLFTFLAAEDEHGLIELFREQEFEGSEFIQILPGQLFDYFAPGIRASVEQDGMHWIWSAVERARLKLNNHPYYDRLMQVVKTLAILHVAGAYDSGAPSTELITFALGLSPANTDDLRVMEGQLETLAAQHLIRYRVVTGGWEFIKWLTDFNIEQEVANRLEEQPPSPELLKTLLSAVLPAPVFQARRYNDHRGMVRYFNSVYRTVGELEADAATGPNWEAVLASLDYADGLVIYVPVYTSDELTRARAAAAVVGGQHERVICATPASPLAARGPLEDLYGLKGLRSDLALRHQEPEALKELDFFEEDTMLRLRRSIAPLVEPRYGASWYWVGQPQDGVHSPGAVSRLLSQICYKVFHRTPRIYNENFNKRNPVSIQVHAAQKVIDALLNDLVQTDLGLTGYGPDVAILNAALKSTGLLTSAGEIGRPPEVEVQAEAEVRGEETANPMAEIWDICEHFYQLSASSEGSNFESLVDRLQKPPYGLRRGVIPLLLATTFKKYAPSSTLQRSGVTLKVTGSIFTEIAAHPTLFTVRIESIDAATDVLLGELEARLEPFVRAEERKQQRLSYLTTGLLRWLQSLPRYARDAVSVSKEASLLRRLIRNASTDPAHALLSELPALATTPAQLVVLLDELEKVYEGLIERLVKMIAQIFDGGDSVTSESHLAPLITDWYRQVLSNSPMLPLFSDPVSEELASIGRTPARYQTGIIDALAKKVVGTLPRDWNDDLARQFEEKLLESRLRLEREVGFLRNGRVEGVVETDESEAKPGQVVELSLTLPDAAAPQTYRFTEVGELSTHGYQLAQSLRRTIDISGRALDVQEKRAIALELVRYLLEGKA